MTTQPRSEKILRARFLTQATLTGVSALALALCFLQPAHAAQSYFDLDDTQVPVGPINTTGNNLTNFIVDGSTYDNGVTGTGNFTVNGINQNSPGLEFELSNSGNPNDFTGTFHLTNRAFVRLLSTNTIPDASAVIVNKGSELIASVDADNILNNLQDGASDTLDAAGGGVVSAGSGHTLTLHQTTSNDFSGALTGDGAVSITAAALGDALDLTGDSSGYTGDVTVVTGTLGLESATGNTLSNANSITVDAGAKLYAGGVVQNVNNIQGAGTFDTNSGGFHDHTTGTTTISGNITGNGSLEVDGTGTLVLSNANDFTGLTTVDNGATLKATVDNVIADSGDPVINGTFDLNNTTQLVNDLSGNGLVTNSNNAGATITNNIVSGSEWDGVIENGSGTHTNLTVTDTGNTGNVFVIGAVQTFTGGADIETNAHVQATVDNIIQSAQSVNVDGTFDVNGTTQTLKDFSGSSSGSVTLSTNSTSGALILNNDTNTEWDGVISDGGSQSGTVEIEGDSTHILTIGNQQTYTGTTTIDSSGILKAKASTNNIIADSSAVDVEGTFDLNGTTQNVNDLNGSNSSASIENTAGGNAELKDNVDTTEEFDGVISGATRFVVQGSGELDLGNANTYTLGTHIHTGTTVKALVNNVIADSGTTTGSGGVRISGTFDVNGTAQLLNDLNSSFGNGSVTLNGGNLTLNIVDGSIWNGDISGDTNSGTALTVTNTGNTGNVLQFNSANTYTGSTDIQNHATLQATTDDVIADSVGVTVETGGTFDVNGTSQHLTDLAGGGSVTLSTNSNAGTLTENIENGSEWDGVISDGGTRHGNLVVTNATGDNSSAVWTIGATQTYTGTTDIQEGAIVKAKTGHNDVIATSSQVNVDGTFDLNGTVQNVNDLSGGSNGSIENTAVGNAELKDQTSTTEEFDGVISGKTRFVVDGSGELDLGGQNTYTLGTHIHSTATVKALVNDVFADSGTTGGSGGVKISGTFDLNGTTQNVHDLSGSSGGSIENTSGDNAELKDHTSVTETFSGVISGATRVVVDGGNELDLGGVNTYTLGTHIHTGTTVKALVNNVMADSGTTTGSGGVRISGIFDVNNTSQLLNDLNSSSGNGSVTLNGGNLTLNIVDGSTWNGVISGSTGSGVAVKVTDTGDTGNILIFNGANTYTGTTEVASGILQVDGDESAATGTVTVDANGVLHGTGTLGGDLVNNGIVKPGDSPGILTVTGNYSGSGALAIDVQGATNPTVPGTDNSQLAVTGTADISGQTLVIQPANQPPKYVRGTVYNILTSSGLTGTFTGLANNAVVDENSTGANSQSATNIANSNDHGLAFRVTYDPADNPEGVDLTIARAEFFADSGVTPNEKAVGGALDTLQETVTPGSPMDTLMNDLSGLSTAAQAGALNTLTGEINADLPGAGIAAQRQFNGMLGKRLGGDCNTDDNLTNPGSQSQRARLGSSGSAYGNYAWACGYGQFGTIDSNGNAGELDSTLAGGAVGVEMRPSAPTVVRAGIGYAHDDLSLKSLSDTADVNSIQAGVYGQYNLGGPNRGVDFLRNGNAYIGGSLSGGYNFADTRRHIAVGPFTGTATASPSSFNLAAEALIGFLTHVDRLDVEPVAGVEYIYNNQDSYTESGAGAANLSVSSKTSNSLRFSAGGQISTTIDNLRNGMSLVPQAHAAFIYDAGDINPTINESIGGAGFTVEGSDPGRAGAQAGVGATLHLSPQFALFGDYNGTFKEHETDHAILGGVKVSW